jgi:hypothetical protein
MKRLLLLLAFACGGCAAEGDTRTYDNNDLELVAGNAAKMACSCLYVMNRDETYCKAWVRASPSVARLAADPVKKTVEASAFIVWTAKARFIDERRGCLLE